MSGVLSGANGMTKIGAGTMTLSNNTSSTFTGLTTVTAGELRLNPGADITNSSEFNLNGGLLSTTNITAGRTISTATTGTLELTANSNIVLNGNIHHLYFADSHTVTWNTGTFITITGWQGGYNGTSGTEGQIFVGTTSTGLTVNADGDAGKAAGNTPIRLQRPLFRPPRLLSPTARILKPTRKGARSISNTDAMEILPPPLLSGGLPIWKGPRIALFSPRG